MGDVRARAAAAYVQLQQQLTDPLERRVLLGEGLPARAPLAVPRQAPAPYEYGKYVLDAEGSSVLAGDCVDLQCRPLPSSRPRRAPPRG